jgi:hypothetical protein
VGGGWARPVTHPEEQQEGLTKIGRGDVGLALSSKRSQALTKRENGMRRVVIDLRTDHFDAFARTLELSDDGHCGACRRR